MTEWEIISVDVNHDPERGDHYIKTGGEPVRAGTVHEAIAAVLEPTWELVSVVPLRMGHEKQGVVTTAEVCLAQRLWFKRPKT